MASNARSRGGGPGGGDEIQALGSRAPKVAPAHRGTRYKEKFQMLREKYDQVNAVHQEYERDLNIANARLRKLQAENDLLLDAIYITLSASQPPEEHMAPVTTHAYRPRTPPHQQSHPSHPSQHHHPSYHYAHPHQHSHHPQQLHQLPPPGPPLLQQQQPPRPSSQLRNHVANGNTNGTATPNGTSRQRHEPNEQHDGLSEYPPHEMMNGRN